MFKKILIANRGEIASRIIRTCHSMGIETVAVYSEADANAPHVKLACEAYLIGKPRVNESYLNVEKIIEVAKRAKVDAIHPGYGFLSENSLFAKVCEENGFVFIGPTPEVIEKMGDKLQARLAMEAAGVPIVPGNSTPLFELEKAKEVAETIGFPLMLKASAGGGGIGMQVIQNMNDLEKLFDGNRKRAESFFGNGAMFLEKLIENPRHIEIQILADHKGNTVFLGERECSIQRRHQKIVEEAPSKFVDNQTRKNMGETAVKAAKSIGYSNAGTVEFIVDDEKNYYFLEMNTRLQVEHPITEEITGLDLVEQQIRIAFGELLNIQQSEVELKGHSIEVRIYAEDPVTFYPSPGKVTKLQLPTGENIRHELAIEEGLDVSPFYDPMIGKLIVTSNLREESIEKLARALDEYEIEGIKSNIPILKEIIRHPEFNKGNTTTSFINNYLSLSHK